MEALFAPITDPDHRSLVPNMLRRLAVGLSVYDPDHALHDHMMSIESRGSEVNAEGQRHLAGMVALATTSAASLAAIEFRAIIEIPDSCREILAEAREAISEISWLLWGVRIALESPEAVGEPPGQPGEILMRCAMVAAASYEASISRKGSAVLPVDKDAE